MITKCLFSGLWIVAFICSLFFVNAWQLELFGASILTLFIWAAMTLSTHAKTQWAFPKLWTLRFLGAFWLLSFLSILHSDIVNISLMAFCFFSALPLSVFVFLMQSEANPESFKQSAQTISYILALILGGLGLWAMAQFFFLQEYFGQRAHHPLANPNSLAALLCLGLFPALGWLLHSKTKKPKALSTLLCILLFGGIATTASRGIFFAFIAFLPIFGFLMRAQLKPNLNWLLALFVGFTLLFLATSYNQEGSNVLASRVLDTIALNDKDISNNRFNIWSGAWNVVKEHWLIGTGFGTFFLYYPEFKLPTDPFTAFYAHNDPMQYWAELGIAGFILFYLFVFSIVITALKTLSLKNLTTQHRTIITACSCSIGAIILHTHISFNFYNLSILFVLGFLLSVLLWTCKQYTPTIGVKYINFPNTMNNTPRVALTFIPFLFIGFIFLAFVTSEHYTNKARDNMLAGNLEGFADDIMRANKTSFQGNYRSYLLAANVPLSLLEEGQGKFSEDQRKEIYDQTIFYLNQSKNLNPRSSASFYYLGKIQKFVPASFASKETKTPETYFKQALKLDPKHIGARIELAKLYAQNGDKGSELKTLEGGLQYYYNTSYAIEYYQYLSRLYLESGDVVKTQSMLGKVHTLKKRISRQEARKELPQLWQK